MTRRRQRDRNPQRNRAPKVQLAPCRTRQHDRHNHRMYDFSPYSIVTGWFSPKLFSPPPTRWSGSMAGHAIFFVGFIARPGRAALFGHWG